MFAFNFSLSRLQQPGSLAPHPDVFWRCLARSGQGLLARVSQPWPCCFQAEQAHDFGSKPLFAYMSHRNAAWALGRQIWALGGVECMELSSNLGSAGGKNVESSSNLGFGGEKCRPVVKSGLG